jgi:hypothetical protein
MNAPYALWHPGTPRQSWSERRGIERLDDALFTPASLGRDHVLGLDPP